VAASHYNAAITASLKTGMFLADIATYLLRTDVSYATAAVKWQQKIANNHGSLYCRGFEGNVIRLNIPVWEQR
jgi:hypothetical protein